VAQPERTDAASLAEAAALSAAVLDRLAGVVARV